MPELGLDSLGLNNATEYEPTCKDSRVLLSARTDGNWRKRQEKLIPMGIRNCSVEHAPDADEVRNDLLDLVKEKLADPAAVVVIDETGFVKKGTKSVGVAPPYSGTAGKIGHCQLGVLSSLCSGLGGRYERIERTPFTWVTADSVYGAEYHLRRFLTEHSIPSVLAVAPHHQVRLGFKEGSALIRVDEWLARKSHQLRWHRLSAGWGSKGPRFSEWAWWKMNAEVPDGWQAWILVRRNISDPTQGVYDRVCAPKQTTLQQIVQGAGQRWKVEEAIERAKSECGLEKSRGEKLDWLVSTRDAFAAGPGVRHLDG